jgi:hypothetical protein
VSSAENLLFAPLTLVGVLILVYLVIRVIQALIIIGPRPEAPLPTAAIEARRHALGKILSALLFWAGLFLLDSLAWLYIFVQGDDLRVAPRGAAAIMVLVGSGLIVAALVVRNRLRRRRLLG